MEVILGLDLSNTETGWALAKNGKIVKYGTIKPSDKLTSIEKLIYVVEEVQTLILKFKVEELVIEDIYCGFVQAFLVLARLQGAIIVLWHKFKLRPPIIYRTTSARKMIGVPATKKKKDVMEGVNRILNKNITNDNIADAIVLVLAYYQEKRNGSKS